jgi:hypothetical protein
LLIFFADIEGQFLAMLPLLMSWPHIGQLRVLFHGEGVCWEWIYVVRGFGGGVSAMVSEIYAMSISFGEGVAIFGGVVEGSDGAD